jgi:hypothetical protein
MFIKSLVKHLFPQKQVLLLLSPEALTLMTFLQRNEKRLINIVMAFTLTADNFMLVRT